MGSILKEIREKNMLSQAELSRLTGISQQALSYMEVTGKYPSSENLLKIANVYNVTTDYLLGVEKREGAKDLEIINIFNNMTEEEKNSLIKYGKYIIASRHQ